MRILLITSRYTGYGHMSIASALCEVFERDPDIVVRELDGFSLLGSHGPESAKLYNTMTRVAPPLWKAIWEMTSRNDLMPDTMAKLIRKNLSEEVRSFQPDRILTVHSMFVGSVIEALEQEGLKIPVICLQADITDLHPSWCDARTLLTLCPTEEAYESSLKHGVPREKLRRVSWPVRSAFFRVRHREYDPSHPLRCLLLGGGGGAGDLGDYTRELLTGTDAFVTVICGYNDGLRERLTRRWVPDYAERIRVLGFCDRMEREMADADVLFARASPNCMFEALSVGLPQVLTGALPGQESENPRYAEEHGFAVNCSRPEQAPEILSGLTADGGRRLAAMSERAKALRQETAAGEIVRLIGESGQSNTGGI